MAGGMLGQHPGWTGGEAGAVSELAACASGTLCMNLIFLEVTQTGSVKLQGFWYLGRNH